MTLRCLENLLSRRGTVTIVVAVILAGLCLESNAQERFLNQGQVWQIMSNIDALVELRADSLYGILKIDTLTKELPAELECLAYRSTDGLLYAMHATSRRLYTIDALGAIREVTTLNIDPGKAYLAGDITPDGRYFTVIGSDEVRDLVAVTIDLESPGYPSVSKALSTNGHSADIAYHPYTGRLFSYDYANHAFAEIDLNSGAQIIIAQLPDDGEVGGVYFTPFGELRGFGTTQFGVASAIFQADPATGKVGVVNSGGVYNPKDMAANSETVGLRLRATPAVAFPCEEIVYSLSLANSTGSEMTISGISGQAVEGIELEKVLRNKYDQEVLISSDKQGIEMGEFTLKPGIDSILIRSVIGDVPKGRYKMQVELSGLSAKLGFSRISDDPVSHAYSDSTAVRVDRIDDDSVHMKRFFCLGEDILLDASDFGNNIQWWNGSSASEISVQTGGNYTFVATTGCNEVFGTFEVTVAQCPFTIGLTHDIQPRSTFPCSEVLFTYILENDAGTEQTGLTFTDTLWTGFEFIEVVASTFDGKLVDSGSPQVITIEDLTLGVGYDTLIALVLVGNISPKDYGNRAILYNLPSNVGTHRYSDDPRTVSVDSTFLEVLGLDQDSLLLDVQMCNGQPVSLDASKYGVAFLWDSGLETATRTVFQPGTFGVTVFDGCDESYVTFRVVEAPGIRIGADSTVYRKRLSDEIVFSPWISNEGDSLSLTWSDPADTSLSCYDCLYPAAIALNDITYTLTASNEVCADSLEFSVRVDKSRRLYVPNIFTPNGDGINDVLTISSPDYGLVEQLVIRDRWGSVVHGARNFNVNASEAGWDGKSGGRFVSAGVYTWSARIMFFDGVTEWFGGEVTVLR